MTGSVSQEDFDKLMDRVKTIEEILGPPGGGTGTVMEQIQEIRDRLDAIRDKLDGLDDEFVAKPEFEELREIVGMIDKVVKRQASANNRTMRRGQ